MTTEIGQEPTVVGRKHKQAHQDQPMTQNAKRTCGWCVAVLMFIVALYSAMGILQAGSIYDGERALFNLRFWGAIAGFSLVVSVVAGIYAFRLKLQ